MKTTARKTTTSTEVKARWNAKTYKRYQINFRKDEDADLISFIEREKEKIGITELFRAGIEKVKAEGY